MTDWTLDTQDGQIGRITTALGADAVLLEGFAATERLSEPFSIICDVFSPGLVDFGPQLGTSAGVVLEGEDYVARAFHGVLTEASETGNYNNATQYSLVLRPWFWLLQLGRNSRIFQKMSARDIIKQVFTDAGVSTSAYQFSLTARGTIVREYCVQYGESDFNFVSRLMEEEGIYYYFIHTATSHVMKLCDGPSCHAAFEPGDVPVNSNARGHNVGATLWSWSSHVRPALTEATLRDVHFKAPDNTNQAVGSDAAGNTNIVAKSFEYPGGFSYLTDDGATPGADFATLRLQAGRAERTRYTGDGDVAALTVGCLMTTAPVDPDDDSVEVMVTGTLHRLSGQSYVSAAAGQPTSVVMSVEGVPSDVPWRPARRAIKPMARGPQTATVVGTSGEVIDVDAFGRVRVQFPWDRLDKKNETSSCWIRVSQSWADAGFGHMHIPRIGEEVIVDFLDGDMDRPIITGRVYNATKTVPYALPDEKTKSTWKSQTVGASGEYPDTVSPPDTSTKGFNEIRFEDKGGSEEVYVHAQKDFKAWYRFDETRTTGHNTTIDVGYDRVTTVKHDETKTVTDGDETHTVKTGKRTTSIKDDETLTVETGKMATTVKTGDQSVEISTGNQSNAVKMGNQSNTIDMGNQTTVLKMGNISVKCDLGTITMEAMQSITLKVGQSTVVVDQMGVHVKGMMVESEAQIMSSTKGLLTETKADAMLTLNGAITMIN